MVLFSGGRQDETNLTPVLELDQDEDKDKDHRVYKDKGDPKNHLKGATTSCKDLFIFHTVAHVFS